jgi:glycosyltransferase involved in cell wall biosynthesis
MDWLPNTDGVRFFLDEVFPRIRDRRPECTVAIVGRKPSPDLIRLAEGSPGVTVTGTVDDVRPWLHGARVSIVPLRIGGGTRLKIYEAMAAGVPVVSTAVGAEGLDYRAGETIQIGDSAEAFADRCLGLLADETAARRQAEEALALLAGRYSWSAVSAQFEALLF